MALLTGSLCWIGSLCWTGKDRQPMLDGSMCLAVSGRGEPELVSARAGSAAWGGGEGALPQLFGFPRGRAGGRSEA